MVLIITSIVDCDTLLSQHCQIVRPTRIGGSRGHPLSLPTAVFKGLLLLSVLVTLFNLTDWVADVTESDKSEMYTLSVSMLRVLFIKI